MSDEEESAYSDEINQEVFEYELPEDLVSRVSPAKYLQEIYQQPIIQFEELANRVPEFIKTAKYKEIADYGGIPITESYRMFINSFDQVGRDQICNPPGNVAAFANYITSQFPQKACFQIASSWPPGIPRIANPIEPTVAILIKMVSEANDHTNLLRFLSNAIFPKVWTTKGCDKTTLLALTPCKYRKKEGFWAYIVRETNEFFLVSKEKNGEITAKAQGIVTKCAKSKDKESIIVKGDAGRIADFSPLDLNVIPLWTHLYSSKGDDDDDDTQTGDEAPKDIPFPYFFTHEGYDYFPDIAYQAFYDALTANDNIFLRAILESQDVPYEVADAVLSISLHSRKVHQTFSTIVSFLIESNSAVNPISIYSKDSDTFYRKFIHALFERFCPDYVTQFLRRIVLTVNNYKSLNEKLFFTVIKYITMSSQFIPIQIRHFASVLREYATTKYNSRGFVYLLLGGFFGLDFICPVLANPQRYLQGVKVKNPSILKKISELLQYVFHGAELPEKYADWNPRIIKHTLPLMEEFIFSIGDITGELPLYPVPEQEKVAPAIEKIIRLLLADPTTLRRVYDEAQLPEITYTPPIGMNFATAIADFFRQCYDRGQKRTKTSLVKKVKPNPLQFPKLPMYGMVTTKRAGLNGSVASMSELGDGDSISLTGGSPKERSLTIPPRIFLPSKPKNQYHNPIKKGYDINDSDEETTLSERPKTRKRAVPMNTFTPPPAPPKQPKKRIAYDVSATETISITEDTDISNDPELKRGKKEPLAFDIDDNDTEKKRVRRKKSEKENVLLTSGISKEDKDNIVKQEEIKLTSGRLQIRTIRSNKGSRGTGNRGNDSI